MVNILDFGSHKDSFGLSVLIQYKRSYEMVCVVFE